tara:strand:+ start:303 stop:572 length:270 start_codon:yes stop_codon:yes gene_type:complete
MDRDYYLAFENFKEKILKRDNYECQNCNGSTGLLVHHIIPRRNNPKRDVPDNLITLCFECHEMVHGGNHGFLGLFTKHFQEMIKEKRNH